MTTHMHIFLELTILAILLSTHMIILALLPRKTLIQFLVHSLVSARTVSKEILAPG